MSLFKAIDDRTGLITGAKNIANRTVPASWCCCRFLPVAIIFAFILQGITGLFLWAFYAPSAQTAWESVYHIQYEVPYGWLVRGIHHYSAQLLVGMLAVYILLMILHGAYRKPREFVYWSAVVMFLFSLCSCLTGDLLNWSLSGYFATMARVSFLQVLPKIGVAIYQIVVGGPDPQFGTLTLTRFTVLHVAVFGGGFLLTAVFWKWCDYRARNMFATEKERAKEHCCALACAKSQQRPFWKWEAVFSGFVCLLVMAAVLALVFQHSYKPEQIAARAETLPAEAYLGAELTSPADPGGSYDAARPEWSFRSLYHLSKQPIFSKIGMIFAIFIIPGCLAGYFFIIPILGNCKWIHYLLILPVTLALFAGVCWYTYLSYWDDYRNPDHAPTFLAGKAEADVLKQRAVELASAPTGIPKTGALSLLNNDPLVQGPKLFKQHCASCHNFEPFGGITENPDFHPINCAEPTAPNLYGSGSVEWIKGFHDKDKLVSDDYFGKTTSFAKKGSMIGFATGRVYSGLLDKNKNFVLNTSGSLVGALIAPDASAAFDLLEASFKEVAKDAKNKPLIEKGEYIPKLKDAVKAKFSDAKFLEDAKIKLPKPVIEALQAVLLATLDDPVYVEMLKDEDNIAVIFEDDDAATFLEENYLATLCGSGEPIPPEKMKYIDQLRDAIIASCNEMATVLHEESKLTDIRPLVDGKYQGLKDGVIRDMEFLTCTECHAFYGNEKKDQACDLRGYMSKKWLVSIISDPTAKSCYGKKNDRMPAYLPATGDALLKPEEVDMLADWMIAKWYRAPKLDNKSLLGPKSNLLPVKEPAK